MYDDNYDMTDKELEEIGFMPYEVGATLYGNETLKDREDGGFEVYSNDRGGPVLVRVVSPGGSPGGTVLFFEGPPGQERMVKTMFPNSTQFYEGPPGQERHVKSTFTNGNNSYYEGESGEERLVKVELPNGGVQFFEGPTGQERLTAARVPAGDEIAEGYYIFEGSRGQERMVRRVFREYEFLYEGEKGKERVVLTKFVEGYQNDGVYESEFD